MRRNKKQVVRLNESQLKRIIKESVRKVLREWEYPQLSYDGYFTDPNDDGSETIYVLTTAFGDFYFDVNTLKPVKAHLHTFEYENDHQNRHGVDIMIDVNTEEVTIHKTSKEEIKELEEKYIVSPICIYFNGGEDFESEQLDECTFRGLVYEDYLENGNKEIAKKLYDASCDEISYYSEPKMREILENSEVFWKYIDDNHIRTRRRDYY